MKTGWDRGTGPRIKIRRLLKTGSLLMFLKILKVKASNASPLN